MSDKNTKNKQKSLAADIVSSIETSLGEKGQASKKIKKSIEKSAGKLAKKLTKLMLKDEKKKAKSEHEPDKLSKKAKEKDKKKADKAEKSAVRALTTPVIEKPQLGQVNPTPAPVATPAVQPSPKPINAKLSNGRQTRSTSAFTTPEANTSVPAPTTAEGV